MKHTRAGKFITWFLILSFTLMQVSPAWGNAAVSSGNSPGSGGGGGSTSSSPNGGGQSTSDPVDTKSGNLYFTETDLSFNTPGVPLVFERQYNSIETYNSPVGPGWSHSFDWRLIETREIICTVVPPVTNQNFKINLWEGTQLLCDGSLYTNSAETGEIFRTNAVTLVPAFSFGSPVKKAADVYVMQPGGNYFIDLNDEPVYGSIGGTHPVPVSGLEDMQTNALPVSSVSYTENKWLDVYQGNGNSTRFWDSNTNGIYFASDRNWKITASNDLWILHLPGGEQRIFNADGRMVRHQDGWGKGITFTYDGTNSLLVSAVHDNGQSLQFFYEDGHLSSVNAGTELSLGFTYTTNGHLASSSRQAGSLQLIRQYNYADGILTQRVNSAGHKYNFGYKADSNGTLTAKASSLSINTERWYHHSLNYWSETATDVLYRERGLIQTHRYTYSSKTGNLTEHFGPGDGGADAETRGSRYTYNSGKDKTGETLFDDGAGEFFSTFTGYDHRHNPTNTMIGFNTTNLMPVSSTVWNQTYMLPASVENAEGEKAAMEYRNGSLSKLRAFYSESNSYDTVYSYTVDGLLAAVTNANGNAVQYTYDSRGYPQAVIPAAGPRIETVYDSHGNLTRTEILPEGDTNGTGRITQYQVNPLGWVDSVTYADGLSVSNQYNKLGDLTNTVDRAGRVTEFTYTPESRLASKTQYLEQNGSNVPVRLAYDFDQQFNTLRITEPRGRYVESYDFDIQDRITAVTNIEGQTMRFDYGVGGFVKKITRFDGSAVSSAYDSAGRKISSDIFMTTTPVFEQGEAFSSEPESYTNWVSPGDGSHWVVTNGTYTYYTFLRNDPVNPVPEGYGSHVDYSYYADGQLKTVSDGATSVSNAYDRLNRLTDQVVQFGNRQSTIANVFDPAGNVTNSVVSIGNPQSAIVNVYAYDSAERLTGISQSVDATSPPRSFSLNYSPVNGLISSVVSTNSGVEAHYAYDLMDRRQQINWLDASSNVLRSLDYGFDSLGMITNITTETGEQRVYVYDTINRLTAEQHYSASDALTYSAAYEYDLAGNRTRTVINGVTNGYTLGEGDRLTSWGGSGSALYDAAGNTTNLVLNSGRELSLQWNEEYQLTSVISATSAVEYSYDVLGRRASCSVGSASQTNTEFYIYDGNQVVADLDADGEIIRSYTWGPGIDNLLAMTVHGSTETNTYYALKDHQNTVLAFTDTSGNIVESYEYDAWGNVLDMKDASGSSIANHQSAIGNRYMWQGREYDSATGLYFFRARWYSPETGRWLSKDPIGISGGLNLYVFCENDPVNFTDPFGESGIVGAAVGAGVDFGLQVVTGMVNGQSLSESVQNVNWGSVAVSAAVSAAGYGLLSAADKVADVYNMVKAGTSAAKITVTVGKGGAISTGPATQIVKGQMVQQGRSQIGKAVGGAAVGQAAKQAIKSGKK